MLDTPPVRQPEIPLIDKDIDPDTGKVIERTAEKRVSELHGGTIRVDLGS